jgi:hypothetical protein
LGPGRTFPGLVPRERKEGSSQRQLEGRSGAQRCPLCNLLSAHASHNNNHNNNNQALLSPRAYMLQDDNARPGHCQRPGTAAGGQGSSSVGLRQGQADLMSTDHGQPQVTASADENTRRQGKAIDSAFVADMDGKAASPRTA